MARGRDTTRASGSAAPDGGAARRPRTPTRRQGLSLALSVKVVRLAHAEGLPLPAYQSEGAAGLDLLAAVPANKALTLRRGARALVPTGLILELPPGFEAQIRPRSGLAYRHGVTVLNSPGTVDSDYRGEVQVLLINHGDQPFTIKRGERIAQLVVAPVTRAPLIEARSASATTRGAGGFGSTGRGGEATKRPRSADKRSKKKARLPVRAR